MELKINPRVRATIMQKLGEALMVTDLPKDNVNVGTSWNSDELSITILLNHSPFYEMVFQDNANMDIEAELLAFMKAVDEAVELANAKTNMQTES